MPLVQLQRRALSNGQAGYRTAFGDKDFGDVLGTTVWLALATTFLSLVIGTAMAFVADQLPPRLRMLGILPLLPIVLPPIASIVGWSFLLNSRTGYINVLLRHLPWWSDLVTGPIDVYTARWIVLVTVAGFSSFVYAFVSAGLRSIPSSLLEAARTAGHTELRANLRVAMPLLRPAFANATVVVFLLALSQVTAPLLLGRQHGIDVLATEMINYTRQTPANYGAAAAIGSPLLFFGVALVVIQRLVIGDATRFVTHGSKGFTERTHASWWSVPILLTYGAFVVALPLLALIDRALAPFSTGKIRFDRYSLENVRTTLGDPRLRDAVATSLTVSVIAVIVSLVVGFIAASFLAHASERGFLRHLVDLLVELPLMIPAAVFGVGFLMTYAGEPFNLYGSRIVIVLVYVTLMIPFATRMQLTSLISLGTQYSEASRVAGAGRLRTTARVMLPLARPAIGGAAALMFVLLSHEFTASVMVRSTTTQVMGTILFDFYENGTFGWVATMSLVMAFITSCGLVVAFVLGGRRVLDRM
ncbi:MAG: ABC transporter permease [Acidimicrobiia bacterium]